MTETITRSAVDTDIDQLLALWSMLFDDETGDTALTGPLWRGHAESWFAGAVSDHDMAYIPVVETDGGIVATAVGTIELGIPNPFSPRGRTVRLANLVTLPAHRARGYGSALVEDVIRWARTVEADRVDLSATPDGQAIYARAGFVLTSAPRMKLVL